MTLISKCIKLMTTIKRLLYGCYEFIIRRKVKAELIPIPNGKGDCFFIVLSDGQESYHIMVDCQTFNKQVKLQLAKLNNHIDLLVVTHIDKDHIPGITTMIESTPDLYLGKVLFNSYQREPQPTDKPLPDEIKKKMLELKGGLSVVADALDTHINAEHAKLLSEVLLEYEKVNGRKVWERKYLTSETEDLYLGKHGKWGHLTFLSPSKDAVKKLDKEFRRMFLNLIGVKKEADYDNDSSIYELIMHYVATQKAVDAVSTPCHIKSSESITEQLLIKEAKVELSETENPNLASIAFVWEKDDNALVCLGDAPHEEIVSQLRTKFKDKKTPWVVNAIKISHHGSTKNTSKELLRLIDSKCYYILGGQKPDSPSINTLAKIVTNPLHGNIDQREIHVTKTIDSINDLEASGLQNRLNFKIVHHD